MKIALYLRVSTDEQTVENQRAELSAWAKRCGCEVVAEFLDEGVSGDVPVMRRPGGAALFDAAARREFDKVAFWALDRFGRDDIDLRQGIRRLTDLGVGVFSLREPFIDTSGPEGELILAVFAALGRFEQGRRRERQKAGIERRRAEGKPMGSRAWKSRPLAPDGPRNAYIRELLSTLPVSRIPAAVKKRFGRGCSLSTVYAVKTEMEAEDGVQA